ncbi:MAG: fibrillarin-like rRNA/tRNA 2'-O-methyltransferase [Candidatus Hodarchaeales archaeon]|jgi:fibrillarin-like pre-rRNA processing protein
MKGGIELKIEPHSFPGTFLVPQPSGETRLATKNAVPGASVYSERLLTIADNEYREWNPYRSKLASAIRKGLEVPEFGGKILYLGAASGTTCSHIADILSFCGEGILYAVEFSHRVARDLVKLADTRKNIVPILADARDPRQYRPLIGQVDMIYQDLAQPDQSEILIRNAKLFLRPNGIILLAIKARSVDATASPNGVFANEIQHLQPFFTIQQELRLDPFQKDHMLVFGVRKS